MKNLVMTPRSSSETDRAPWIFPISLRIGGISAIKMTSTSGGSIPPTSPDTSLKGPFLGITSPTAPTHFWIAATGIRNSSISATNATHTPQNRSVRSQARKPSDGQSTPPGRGAPATCQTVVSWCSSACVASARVRLDLNVTNAEGLAFALALACSSLMRSSRKPIRSMQNWTASILVDSFAPSE